MSTPTPHVEYWQAGNGRWYFHKRNRNGRRTHPSQGYKSKATALKAAARDIPGLPIVPAPARMTVPST